MWLVVTRNLIHLVVRHARFMSVACGVIFFDEPAGIFQFGGIALTIAGLVTMGRRAKAVSDG